MQGFEENSVVAPDFVIGGAMKCGTSTVHSILASHPEVYIPNPELHFFDYDNVIQHPDFYDFHEHQWQSHSGASLFEPPVEWYNKQYANCTERVKGEDSTTYIASPKALARLYAVKPDVKLIIMLRQPTDRAYSHYWHMLRSGRATYSFEKTIEFYPESVLSRSLYLEQLREAFRIFPRKQIKVVLFEELLSEKESVVNELCRFIGVEASQLPQDAMTMHTNAARLPRFINVQLIKNTLFRKAGSISYQRHFLNKEHEGAFLRDKYLRGINYLHSKINPLTEKKPPRMKENTRHFLNEYFASQLDGIDELLERPITAQWFVNK